MQMLDFSCCANVKRIDANLHNYMFWFVSPTDDYVLVRFVDCGRTSVCPAHMIMESDNVPYDGPCTILWPEDGVEYPSILIFAGK